MKRAQQERHPDLFESDKPPIALPLDQTKVIAQPAAMLNLRVAHRRG